MDEIPWDFDIDRAAVAEERLADVDETAPQWNLEFVGTSNYDQDLWRKSTQAFEGIAFFTIADLARPKPEATHVYFKSYDGYSTNNPLSVCLDDDVLVAHKWNGQPLSAEHGGPARVIVPKRYAWKGAKFIHEIIFLDRDLLGYWELRGYSNTAAPWKEERFADKDHIPPGFYDTK